MVIILFNKKQYVTWFENQKKGNTDLKCNI